MQPITFITNPFPELPLCITSVIPNVAINVENVLTVGADEGETHHSVQSFSISENHGNSQGNGQGIIETKFGAAESSSSSGSSDEFCNDKFCIQKVCVNGKCETKKCDLKNTDCHIIKDDGEKVVM